MDWQYAKVSHHQNNMKTVIAPVDFSETSRNALFFAAELCKRAFARLIVFNAVENGEEEKAKDDLEQLDLSLKTFFGSDLRFDLKIAPGDFVDLLKQLIEFEQPDIIVMGTKGASGLKRIFIGSNTVNIIAKTEVPVLVIPEAAQFENFIKKEKNRVVLATDLESLENEDILDILKEITLLIIDPKLRILSVRGKGTRLPYLKSMERDALLSVFADKIESERSTVFGNNVIGGIEYYLKTHKDTGLLAMIARDTGDLIQKHYTREMASHTDLPLLVLHDGKKS